MMYLAYVLVSRVSSSVFTTNDLARDLHDVILIDPWKVEEPSDVLGESECPYCLTVYSSTLEKCPTCYAPRRRRLP